MSDYLQESQPDKRDLPTQLELEALRAIVRHGTIKAAAESLYLSPHTVNRSNVMISSLPYDKDLRITIRRSPKAVIVGLIVGAVALQTAFSIAVTGSTVWGLATPRMPLTANDRILSAALLVLFSVPFWLCAYWCSGDVEISYHHVSTIGFLRSHRVMTDLRPVQIIQLSDTHLMPILRLFGRLSADTPSMPIALRYGQSFVPLNYLRRETSQTVSRQQFAEVIKWLLTG